jgi:hypothetical protein
LQAVREARFGRRLRVYRIDSELFIKIPPARPPGQRQPPDDHLLRLNRNE